MSTIARELSPLFTWRSSIASPESTLTPTQRLVALVLSLHMNERGGSCFPSMATLAGEAGCSTSTARTAIQQLAEHGWLIRESGQGGNGRSARYTATVPTGSRRVESTVPTGKPIPYPPGAGEEDVKEDVSTREADASLLPGTVLSESTVLLVKRPRDLVFDELSRIFGEAPRGKAGRGPWNAACSSLKQDGATPAELQRAANLWPRHYPDARLTPTALAKHFRLLVPIEAGRDHRNGQVDEAERERRRTLALSELGVQA